MGDGSLSQDEIDALLQGADETPSYDTSGTGTIKMNGSTNRNHEGWLKFYVGATAVWLPYWVTIT
jgi:hypothetical protein